MNVTLIDLPERTAGNFTVIVLVKASKSGAGNLVSLGLAGPIGELAVFDTFRGDEPVTENALVV